MKQSKRACGIEVQHRSILKNLKAFPIGLLATLACLACTNRAQADLTLDLGNATVNSEFDGDGVGDTAGPFSIDGFDVLFTTNAVTGSVATSSFGLGVDNGVGDPDSASFNIGETWSIIASHSLFFKGLDIGGLQSEETFSVQSDAWAGLSGITTGLGVTYISATGTFELTDGPSGDIFTLAELTGGSSLYVSAGVAIQFGGLTSTFGPNDDVELESFTVQAVPEPGFGLVAGLAALCGTARRRQRNPRLV